MLTKKQLLVIFLVCAIAFGAYFFRPYAIGYDSYQFLQPNRLQNELEGAKLVFSWLNGNILAAKCLLFACLFASCTIISLIGQGYCPKNGWKAGLLVFLSPIFLLEFLKMESEAIAYPILFLSLYFLLKPGANNKIAAAFLILVASTFWLGSLTYYAVLAFYFWPVALTLIALSPFLLKYIPLLAPSPLAQETAFIGAGFTFHMGLLLGLLAFWKDKPPLRLLPALAVFGALGFVNGKFGIHLAPVLAVALASGLGWLGNKWEGRILGLLVAVLLLSPVIILTHYEPTQEQIGAVQLAVQEAGGETVHNDWQYGHMIEYFGGRASAKFGGRWPDANASAGWKLTREQLDCDCLNYPGEAKVYRC